MKTGSSISFGSLDRVYNKKYSKKFVIKYFTVRTRVKGSTRALTISHTNTIKFLSFPANYTDRKLYMLTSKGQGHKKNGLSLALETGKYVPHRFNHF